ncbi:MAG TPA: NAD-dependent epimerase/dehydratase family protein [Chthonomonadaceae bacterium]|nr:NAD-dependent epimerase/dehydratase family protein [Chthonomonadaceae bacterium]
MTLKPEVRAGIAKLQGPILVLGASGFVGAHVLLSLLEVRSDVVGTCSRLPAWRLAGVPDAQVRVVDLLVESNLDALLDSVNPRTVFDCVAYGGYSFERDSALIYKTNFLMISDLVARLAKRKIACYVHSGSSSEYGDNASGPAERMFPEPNSDYAVSKVATANLLYFYGKKRGLPCANLRLYSVYGPLEDSSRLIPNIVRRGLEGGYPELVSPAISRDFVYISDVVSAFVCAALNLTEEQYGESFNIGSGRCTTIADVACTARALFDIEEQPRFTMPARDWDVTEWYANIDKAATCLHWAPRVAFEDGLRETAAWYEALEDKDRYHGLSKQFELDTKHSVSAIVACYRDGQAIPIMYERLKAVFEGLGVEYEIIFVNDNSPDDSEEAIRELTRNDRRVLGISHSRNFGSQAAFRSGMEIATKNACVLLDGDLQDPPELIAEFVAQWRAGFDVVYGRRVKREAPLHMQIAYKLFYRLFDRFSYLQIPHDAGDFSLMDRRVVRDLLACRERDMFIRGLRAFVGYRQTGIDYVRPERMFGTTTNNLARNIGWAKKGILSFSDSPLSILSYAGTALLLISLVLGVVQAAGRILFPHATPQGITTVLLCVLFFGSLNLFAIGVVGEYIAKIFEEVKQRPHFIRRAIIRHGEVRAAAETQGGQQ